VSAKQNVTLGELSTDPKTQLLNLSLHDNDTTNPVVPTPFPQIDLNVSVLRDIKNSPSTAQTKVQPYYSMVIS